MFQWLKTIARSILDDPSIPLNSAAALDLFNSSPSTSGVRVTRHTAFGIPALWRGIDLIASTCGRVDTIVYKQINDSKEEDWEHPAYPLLKKRPNSYQTAFTFKQQLVSDCIWSGNGYAYIQRDSLGNPEEIHLLDPEQTYPVLVRDSKTMNVVQMSYVTHVNGSTLTLPFADCIHVKGLGNTQGITGMRLIEVAKNVLGLAAGTVQYSGYYFEQAGMPGLVIQIPGALPKEKVEEWREGLKVQHGGLQQSHRPMILTNGATLANRNLPTAEEMALIESRNMTAVDISNLLGLPPSKFGVQGSVAYNSLEQENLSILNDCYDSWFTRLEQEFEAKTLSEFDKRTERRFIRFDRNKLLAADTASYATMLIALKSNGNITTNELRHRLDLNRVEEDWADGYYGPSNLVPLTDDPEPDADDLEQQQQPDTSGQPAPAQVKDEPNQPQQWQDEALRSLTQKTLDRLFTRVRKSCTEDRLAAFQMARHRDVFLEGLDTFSNASDVLGPILGALEEEIQASLPEQLDAVFSRINTEEITRQLCKR